MRNFNDSTFLKHFFIFLAIIFCITLIEFFYLGKPLNGIDDANIFLNYASHFAHGDGFVYNTHGERVEGFTSMLWVLICAAFFLCYRTSRNSFADCMPFINCINDNINLPGNK